MRRFAARYPEIRERGLEIVRVFHSPAQALGEYLEPPIAAAFPILADPERLVYRRYGVYEGYWGLLNPLALPRFLAAAARGLKPRPEDLQRDGISGNPADFLIGRDGRIERAHYGASFNDSWQPDQVLELLERWSGGV